jgi:hypothetical protein
VRRGAVLALAGALLFALGIALGQALRDNPRPGGAETRVRTLQPLQLPPAQVTVTVTTTP